MKIIFLTALAGAAGALLRWGATRLTTLWCGAMLPWGTLAVNVIGAFAAGFLYILCRARWGAYEEYWPIIFIGFLGAFTTFSTFALESARFFCEEKYGKFLLNLLLQNAVGLAAALAGLYLAKMIFKS